ncbi:MAG: (2Fe-2S)-binding protein [Planctomycetota bacterium]
MEIQINVETHRVDAPDDTPLLWVLRDELGMTGTKFGCGRALCGACTVHVDGQAVRACAFPVRYAEGKQVRTIEGLEQTRVGRAVVEAWIERDVVQCGWCQPGQCMSASALLSEVPNPDDAAIDAGMGGNLCRCGAYPRIRAAIHDASEALTNGANVEGGSNE